MSKVLLILEGRAGRKDCSGRTLGKFTPLLSKKIIYYMQYIYIYVYIYIYQVLRHTGPFEHVTFVVLLS